MQKVFSDRLTRLRITIKRDILKSKHFLFRFHVQVIYARHANFIEGMACVDGCIGGAGCLTHGEKNRAQVDVYGREAFEKTISEATAILK